MQNVFTEDDLAFQQSLDKYLQFNPHENIQEESYLSSIIHPFNNHHHHPFAGMQLTTLDTQTIQLQGTKITLPRERKVRRIAKRDKIKTKKSPSCLMLLQPLQIETSESLRAKNELSEEAPPKEEEQKRRKRISAQVSRDRKKLYIQRIQKQNQMLKERCEQLEGDNQRLKAGNKPIPNQKTSLKSWLILSLILLTVHKEKETFGVGSEIGKEALLDPEYLLSNARCLIKQYSEQPLGQKVQDLADFCSSAEVSKDEVHNLWFAISMGNKRTKPWEFQWNECLGSPRSPSQVECPNSHLEESIFIQGL